MKIRHLGYLGVLGLLGLLGLVFDQPGLFSLFGFYGFYAFFGAKEQPAGTPTGLSNPPSPAAAERGTPTASEIVAR